MTVSTTTNKIVQLGDGVTLVFSFPFAVRSGGQSDIQVFITDTSGNITQLTFGTQYTVALNAAIAPNPTPVGGVVTCSVAPANGALVTILRTMSLTQPTSLANQGTLYQPVLESTDDNQEMQLQQISELQGRAISVAVSDNAPSNLPPAAQRANQALVFDSSGNPTAGVIPASGVISSAMAPFVGASSIAAAKLLLGYGTMANENIGAVGKGIFDDGSGNARVQHLILAVAVNVNVQVTNHMNDYVCTGNLIFNLPKLTTTFNGFEFWVYCVSGSVTLSPNAADNFPGAAGGASIVLVQGQCARLIGDAVSAWQIFTGRVPGIGSTQTRQTFTSGSAATYTTPAGCRRIQVRMIAGGGGGAGSATNGTAGGDSIFNGIHATGGGAGTAVAGVGGSGGAGAASLRIAGGTGGAGSTVVGAPGAWGGSGPFGGFGGNAINAAANTGAGGGGAVGGASAAGGGGAGEYVELIINNPAATYTYTVGAAGAAGTGGGVGAGAAGLIIVDEYY